MTKVRITQRVKYNDTWLMPGEVLDVEDKQAAEWISTDSAIEFGEAPPKPKKSASNKTQEEVTDGDGQNSP